LNSARDRSLPTSFSDEINRTTPRTQSALLEAMNEAQITVDGKRILCRSLFCHRHAKSRRTSGTYRFRIAARSLPDAHQMVTPRTNRTRNLRRRTFDNPIETLEPVADVSEVLPCRNPSPM